MPIRLTTVRLATFALLSASAGAGCAQDQPAGQLAMAIQDESRGKTDNDGTDPTRPVRTASLLYEHLDLTGRFNSNIILVNYTQPLGSGRSSLKFEAALSSVDVLGNGAMGLGDFSIKYTQVPVLKPTHGIVLTAELVLNTASRPELGTGLTVLKPGLIYAWFLKGGNIFAPAVVQSIGLWGDSNRAPVNVTTIDLYFVPRLKNPRFYMTIDPAVVVDWSGDKQFGSLSVTLGYKLGKIFGGKGQMFIKPGTAFSEDRPFSWGVKAGFQLLGF